MSTCDIQPLLSDGRCFGLSCLSRDSQRVAELQLLKEIAGYTGTVQELLTAGKCFSASCLSDDSQTVAELQLWCEILGVALTCFELTTETTDDTGSGDGTATATPVGGIGPFSYSWSDGQTTQTAVGLTGGTAPVGNYDVLVTDLGAPVCARSADVHIALAVGCVPVTDARIYVASLFVDPFPVLWTVTGGTVSQDPMNGDVLATGSITAISIPLGIGCDGTFDLSLIGSCLQSFTMEGGQGYTLPLTGLPNLTFLGLSADTMTSFVAGPGIPALLTLALTNNEFLTSVDASGLANATYIDFSTGVGFGVTTLNISGCVALSNLQGQNQALDQTSVDNALIFLEASGPTVVTVDLSGGTSAAPSGAAIAAKAALILRGGTVTTN